MAGLWFGFLAATTFARGGGEDPSVVKEIIGLVTSTAAAVLLLGFAVYIVRSTKD